MSDFVCAVVVTFNRLDTLRKTLRHLEGQIRPVDKIVIVDNASSDGTSSFLKSLAGEDLYEIVSLSENLGGAGGFSVGMRRAVSFDPDWIWIMDDDAFATPDCLYRLLSHDSPALVRVPVQIDASGRHYGPYSLKEGIREEPVDTSLMEQKIDACTFVGPLFSMKVVSNIGYPREDFFICSDDIEYSIRINRAGFEMISVNNAFFEHSYGIGNKIVVRFGRRSVRSTIPSWKMYYAMRNELYLEMKYGSKSERIGRLVGRLVLTLRMLPGEVIYEDDAMLRLFLRLKGLFDGVMGNMGKRISPNKIISRAK